MRKIQTDKAVAAGILYALFLVVAPSYLFGFLMAPPNSFPIPGEIVQMIFMFGVISAVVAFFEHLFVRGTRERGILSLIFTAWFTFNLYYLLGGGLSGGGAFGEITVTIGYYSIMVNVAFIAWLIIGLGVLTMFINLYEAIA
jgi:hypothetical protein